MKKTLAIILAALMVLSMSAFADSIPAAEAGKVYTETVIDSQDFENVTWPSDVTASTTLTATSSGNAFKSVALSNSTTQSEYSTMVSKLRSAINISSFAPGTLNANVADFGIATESGGNDYFHAGMYTNAGKQHPVNFGGIQMPLTDMNVSSGVYVLNFKIRYEDIANINAKMLEVYANGLKQNGSSSPYCCMQIPMTDLVDNEWNDITFEIYLDETAQQEISSGTNQGKKQLCLTYTTAVNGVLSDVRTKEIAGTVGTVDAAIDSNFILKNTIIVVRPNSAAGDTEGLYNNSTVSIDDVKLSRLTEVSGNISSVDAVTVLADKSVYGVAVGENIVDKNSTQPQGSFDALTLSPQNMGYGVKPIHIISDTEGEAKAAAKIVSFNKEIERSIGVNTGDFDTATTLQTFDTGWNEDGTVTMSGHNIGSFNYMKNSSNGTVERAQGRNYATNNSDYSIKLTKTVAANTQTGTFIAPKNTNLWNSPAPTLNVDGIIKIEFDIKVPNATGASANIWFQGYDSWYESASRGANNYNEHFIIRDGKIKASDYVIENEKWYHFDMTLDFTEKASNEGKGRWIVKVTNESGVTTEVVNALQITAETGTFAHFRLIPWAAAATENWMQLDNIRIYNKLETGISSVSVDGVATTDYSVSASAQSADIVFNAAVLESATATLNGDAVETAVSSDKTTITVPLTGIKAHSDAVIKISGIKGWGASEAEVILNVTDADGLYLKPIVRANGDVPIVYFKKGEATTVTPLAAIYSGNQLKKISIYQANASVAPSASIYNIGTPAQGETLKIMLWDSFSALAPVESFTPIEK